MKLRALVLLFLVSFMSSYGQYEWKYGVLVLRNKDTLRGLIEIPMINRAAISNSHKVKFRENQNAKTERYDHTEVEKLLFNYHKRETATFEYIRVSKSRPQLFKRFFAGDKIRLYGRMISEVFTGDDNLGGPFG